MQVFVKVGHAPCSSNATFAVEDTENTGRVGKVVNPREVQGDFPVNEDDQLALYHWD